MVPEAMTTDIERLAREAADQIKAESMIKVHVKFVDGKVASIDIVRPN